MSVHLSVKEAASYLGLSEDSIRSLYTQKLIKHRRIGPGRGIIKFEREWLDEYLESTIVEVDNAPRKRKRSDYKPSPQPSDVKPKSYSLEEIRRLIS